MAMFQILQCLQGVPGYTAYSESRECFASAIERTDTCVTHVARCSAQMDVLVHTVHARTHMLLYSLATSWQVATMCLGTSAARNRNLHRHYYESYERISFLVGI